MITAIDSNILIDIFNDDPNFFDPSSTALRKVLSNGAGVACEVVWSEVSTGFPTKESFIQAITSLGITFSAINETTALLAGDNWRKYRSKGGKRDRITADFLIGAHAANQCDCLLTRDTRFYRTYYKKLKILDPLHP